MPPESVILKAALRAYFEFILRPGTSNLISVNETTRVLGPLGIDVRLDCRVRVVRPAGQVLVIATSDPNPVVAVHRDPLRPHEGQALEARRQVETDRWEYDLTSPDGQSLHGEYLARLSRFERTQTLALQPPILTLAMACGWGNEIMGVDADAALDVIDVALAVSDLLIGEQWSEHHAHNQYDRFRATMAISEYFGVEALGSFR